MAARSYDFDPDRNVLNGKEPDERTGFVVRTDEEKRRQMRSSRYESVEFTDSSVDFRGVFEDEALISGQVKPEVAAVYDTGYDGRPVIYDPSKDEEITASSFISSDSFDRTSEMGQLTGESFSTPDFFRNPTDLLIGCIIFGLILILEIAGLIIIL